MILFRDTDCITEVVKQPSEIVLSEQENPGREATPAQDLSPPESSFNTEAVVPLPPDPSPAHRTLSWELQYPPGGSTHPSYAYPTMDPRLFFSPEAVPIIDGLPSTLQVSAFVLPMGWRHVSWSGFLPIVFDPYHQAFKLTPIGPLPLTCEEVQQGGLSKYVPGGAEHPEAGLLPDTSLLSDGSDEVYNFEGVDWILPWPKEENFERAPSHGIFSTSSASVQSTQMSTIPTTFPFYDESRDCPDNVVDIKDAWRWLEEKELHPYASYIPTPQKSWRGTGIYRIQRQMKSPIASLMGLTIAEMIAAPTNFLATYLINQNARAFCPFRSVATPNYVNITLLKDVELTLVELLSYFPNHFLWRKGGDRLVRAGFTGSEIANFINWSRALEGDACKLSGSINENIKYEAGTSGGRKRILIERDNGVMPYTAEDWKAPPGDATEYPLMGLTHGLKHMPEGADAGPLTSLIKWCREHKQYRVLLSEVPELLREQNIEPLIEPGDTEDPDMEVLGRYQDILKADRTRVLEDRKKRKALAEKEGGAKRKRIKAD